MLRRVGAGAGPDRRVRDGWKRDTGDARRLGGFEADQSAVARRGDVEPAAAPALSLPDARQAQSETRRGPRRCGQAMRRSMQNTRPRWCRCRVFCRRRIPRASRCRRAGARAYDRSRSRRGATGATRADTDTQGPHAADRRPSSETPACAERRAQNRASRNASRRLSNHAPCRRPGDRPRRPARARRPAPRIRR